MVTLKVISDVHTEFQADKGASYCSGLEAAGVDVLIIAGDFCSWVTNDHSRIVFGNLQHFSQIIYVPGNHEYWDAGPAHLMGKRFRKLEREYPNLTVLDNKAVEIGGHRFLGGTMWFPRVRGCDSWSDFRHVNGGADWIAGQNEAFLDLVRTELQEGDVVISHHLPSQKSVAQEFEKLNTNRFFITECDDLIVQTEPALWVHGHTHRTCDYKIGVTRVVCNPLGYPFEKSGYTEHGLIKL